MEEEDEDSAGPAVGGCWQPKQLSPSVETPVAPAVYVGGVPVSSDEEGYAGRPIGRRRRGGQPQQLSPPPPAQPKPDVAVHWGILVPLDPALPLLCLGGPGTDRASVFRLGSTSELHAVAGAGSGYSQLQQQLQQRQQPRLLLRHSSADAAAPDLDSPMAVSRSPSPKPLPGPEVCQAVFEKDIEPSQSRALVVTIARTDPFLDVILNGKKLPFFDPASSRSFRGALSSTRSLCSGDQIDFFVEPDSDTVESFVYHWVGAAEDPSVTHFAPPPIKSWRRGGLLGTGQQGDVFVAFDGLTGRQMAVKVISESKSPSYREGLEQEVSLCKRLAHEKIVRYLGTEFTPSTNTFCVFMELVSGGSLKQLLDTFGGFSQNVVRMYAIQIVIGLEYLHSNNVSHGDIKAANILVTSAGTIKIADFGAFESRVSGELMTGLGVGTVCWMAPEVIETLGATEKGSFSGAALQKADIWSFGCTVLEMLTDKPPWSECGFENKPIFTAMLHISTKKHIPMLPYSTGSPAVIDLMLQCLRLEPDVRPSCRDLLAHAFFTNPIGHSTSGSTYPSAFHPSFVRISSGLAASRGHSTSDIRSTNSPKSFGRAPGSIVMPYSLEEFASNRTVHATTPPSASRLDDDESATVYPLPLVHSEDGSERATTPVPSLDRCLSLSGTILLHSTVARHRVRSELIAHTDYVDRQINALTSHAASKLSSRTCHFMNASCELLRRINSSLILSRYYTRLAAFPASKRPQLPCVS